MTTAQERRSSTGDPGGGDPLLGLRVTSGLVLAPIAAAVALAAYWAAGWGVETAGTARLVEQLPALLVAAGAGATAAAALAFAFVGPRRRGLLALAALAGLLPAALYPAALYPTGIV